MKTTRKNTEAGIALVWLLCFSAVFFGIAALVIDTMRQQVIAQQAQNAADAAAYAAAGFLNGQVGGWTNAKRAAIDVFRQQKISSVSDREIHSLKFENGSIDPFEEAVLDSPEGNERYLGTTSSVGNLHITIERGQQWSSGFRSLEVDDADSDVNTEMGAVRRPLQYRGREVSKIPLAYKVPVYMLANAVRVTVRVENIQASFGRIFGYSTLGIKEREAVAISDTASTQKVLPLAIPVCKLLLNQQDQSDSAQYDTAFFNPEAQCGRETIFTEANPLGLGSLQYNQRFEGITRYLTYHKMKSDRSLPIWGVLGTPGTAEESDAVARPDTVLRKFRELNENVALEATLGQPFKPLEDVIGGAGLYKFPPTSSDNSLHATLLRLFSHELDGAAPPGLEIKKFTEAFTMDNYPHLRSASKEKIVRFGPEAALEMKLFPSPSTPIIEEEALPYTNPLCTTPEIYSQPYAERKVITANVMLIAPSNPRASYCDYESVYNQEEQDTFPPSNAPSGQDEPTRPIVVGFMKVNLFDFRVSPYQEGVKVPGDANPARIIPRGEPAYFLDQKKYVEEHSEWARCAIRPLCAPPRINPPFCRTGPCGDRPEPPRNLPAAQEWNEWQECFYLPEDFSLYRQCLQALDPQKYLMLGCATLFSDTSSWGLPRPEMIQSGKACFPEKKPGCWPKPGQSWEEADCWTPPKPYEAQYGCGGIRARISCEDSRMTSPEVRGEVSRPKLVK